MKLSRIRRIPILVGAIGLLAFLGPAAVASAAGFTLNLTTPSTPVVGTPVVLQATGTIPTGDIGFPYWFSLDAIPTTVTPTCPPDRWEGAQFAESTGSIVVLSQSEIPDPAGNFSIPVAVTPVAAGSVLMCGYTDDGAATTLAAASLTLNIQPKPSDPVAGSGATGAGSGVTGAGSGATGAGSGATGIAADARRGIRSCLALLGPKKGHGCVRSAVKRANGACRRLPSPSERAACLRAVGKVARRYS
jgi:hypothetical protein